MEVGQEKSENKLVQALSVVGMLVGVIYMIGGGIFALVFNWQFANQHGFTSWLLFGEVIATLKAVFWPFFVSF